MQGDDDVRDLWWHWLRIMIRQDRLMVGPHQSEMRVSTEGCHGSSSLPPVSKRSDALCSDIRIVLHFNAVMRVVKNDFHGKPEEFLDHPIVARLAGMVFMLSPTFPNRGGLFF